MTKVERQLAYKELHFKNAPKALTLGLLVVRTVYLAWDCLLASFMGTLSPCETFQ